MKHITNVQRALLIGAWSLFGIIVCSVLEYRVERDFGGIPDGFMDDAFMDDEVVDDEIAAEIEVDDV